MFYITKKSNVTGETLYHISENRWSWDESKRHNIILQKMLKMLWILQLVSLEQKLDIQLHQSK